jgi:chorismate mutase/prephenate dehydratase
MRIACLGPGNSHGHQAAKELPGKPELVLLSKFALMDAIINVEVDGAVIPIENADGGWVGEIVSLLLDLLEVPDHPMVVLREKIHIVKHVLCGSGSLNQIKKIMSHDQALLQCRKLIRKHKWESILADSTSAAAARVLKEKNPELAAISTKEAAEGLDIIDSSFLTTTTRFILLQKEGEMERTGCDKTFLALGLSDKVGTLDNVTSIFRCNGINMKMIHSSPHKREYTFFVEVEGHSSDVGVRESLAYLSRTAKFLKILGSFPKATHSNGWSGN